MNSLSKTFDQLEKLPRFRKERPGTLEEIEHIQSELCVVLPDEYMQFLRRFGCVRWFGHEIYGITPLDRGERIRITTSDCITMTMSLRQETPSSLLQSDCVVISTDGGGGNFVLFTVGSGLDGQVHWYNLEDSSDPINTWNTFGDFLEHHLKSTQFLD